MCLLRADILGTVMDSHLSFQYILKLCREEFCSMFVEAAAFVGRVRMLQYEGKEQFTQNLRFRTGKGEKAAVAAAVTKN